MRHLSWRRLAPFAVVVFASCGSETPSTERPSGLGVRPTLDPYITGGTVDTGHPAVGALRSGSSGCTATLIGRKTVLTAAHCVNSTTLYFTVGGTQYSGSGRRHPSYSSGANDVALVTLTREVTNVPPAVLNTDPVTVGQKIILVGFGLTGEGQGSFGTKRVGENTIDQVSSTKFLFGGNANVCNGDSGGPSFVLVGGIERVAGVHSQKRNYCGYGGIDMRVDAYVSWIKSAAQEAIGGGTTPPPPADAGTTPVADAGVPATDAGGSTQLAGEGQSCVNAQCTAGLACVTVFSGTSPIGQYCMEVCTNPGGLDPICDGGERCTSSRTAGPVCFNPNNPSQGYTSPGGSTQPPPSEPDTGTPSGPDAGAPGPDVGTPPPPPGSCDPLFRGPFCDTSTGKMRIIGFNPPAPASPTMEQFRDYSVRAVNAIRARTCLPPLARDACLDRIAQTAYDTVGTSHSYFIANCMNSAHNYGRQCECNWAQENIGAAAGTSRTWIDGVHVPLCSMMRETYGTGHRKNIESKNWRRLGVGGKVTSSGAYWMHEFGCDPSLASCPK